ncbi:Bud site selection protein bud4 [Myotisia sp. PD_48]|nr:Bud site selection protein bud4 [Myotisia sp. PD_48]
MATNQHPLSELSPVANRRNSPSWNQNNKGFGSTESSPFENSPKNSPRLFWQGRDPASPYKLNGENKDPFDGNSLYSPTKRSSIENLMRASRVKNSNMFAREHKQEYDPAGVQLLERPLAGGRPLAQQLQNEIDGSNLDARRQLPSQMGGERFTSPSATARHDVSITTDRSTSPLKSPPSPPKSSLSKGTRFGVKPPAFDPRREIWSDDTEQEVDNSLIGHRHAKSVTFDAAPPQVNEYEMTTPVPSSVESSSREGSYDSAENEESFEHNSSMDIEDSFDASLEDTDKTPVVLPEEWQYMTPDNINDESIGSEEDPFGEDYGSPGPEIRPSTLEPKPFKSRIESLDSNGERRPLPPLPPSKTTESPEQQSGFSAALERASSLRRSMPSPLRPASCSKADISGISNGSLSLEERLKLMMVSDNGDYQLSEAEKQRERRMRRAGAKDRSVERETHHQNAEEEEQEGDKSSDETPQPSPRISRESILRNMKRQEDKADDEDDDSSLLRGRLPREALSFDPDVPIPSLESDHGLDDVVVAKEEPEPEIDLYSIPEYQGDDSYTDPHDDELPSNREDDVSSRYSHESREEQDTHFDAPHTTGEVAKLTPVITENELNQPSSQHLHTSSVSTIDGDHPFDMQFLSYVDQSTPPPEERSDTASRFDIASVRDSLHRPQTPDSVIRHPVSEEGSPAPSIDVPDVIATVKAPGAALKIRPSLTPADVGSMAAMRRKVSGMETVPQVTAPVVNNGPETHAIPAPVLPSAAQGLSKAQLRQSSLVKLDFPRSTSDEDLGFGLDAEFDRVMEAQNAAFEISLSQLGEHTLLQEDDVLQHSLLRDTDKAATDTPIPKQRGYLMRQNTKVVIASNRLASDSKPAPVAEQDGSHPGPTPSPRKASQQTWTTEPWNGKSRRQSIKIAGAVPRKRVGAEVVPPLPGHESNAQAIINEDPEPDSPQDCFEDEGDRGRLFVKVVGVKDLDLALPRGERSYFSLTLDNGLHCVTTSWLELGKSAPIGQEFELVVMQDLEFQLTLQMKPDQLKPKPVPVPQSPTKSVKSQKTSTFSRVFASPKKRRELELRQQQEAQQQQQKRAEEQASAMAADPWAKTRRLVAQDGSFARAYIALGDFENQAFGRPLTVDVKCFNEWAVDEAASSVKSKRSTATPAGSGTQRRPPYSIGTLELQLLFVPKPKGASDDDLPKSMNACIREMREADNTASRSWEGFLSQQGGDCPYWRRRFFKLQGSKLTAYHEVTRQPRATINLAKAAKLIDDKSTLTQKETSAKNGRRRKSAFAEEEEGYMFVEEGFRVRFGNGEVIDFYADSGVEKEGWMNVLSETVGKGYAAGSGQAKGWTEAVLRRERSLKKQQQQQQQSTQKPQIPHPPPKDLPPKGARPVSMAPPPRPRHQHNQSQPNNGPPQGARHQKTRSMVF